VEGAAVLTALALLIHVIKKEQIQHFAKRPLTKKLNLFADTREEIRVP
jgi:hypothetical protein